MIFIPFSTKIYFRLFVPVSCVPAGVSDEEDQKPVRLPLRVAVELQPRSNHSWARVQSLAHNPRLRSDKSTNSMFFNHYPTLVCCKI